MKAKLEDHLKDYEKKNKRLKKRLDAGKIEESDYKKWLKRNAYNERHLRRMLEVLTEDTFNANKIAASMIKEHLPDVYALNANYAVYDIDTQVGFDTSYTLYNRDTVERLIKEEPDLLPNVEVDEKKDKTWNYRKIRNEITQGMLQGESVGQMSDRLERVVGMDENAAIRNARTATTSAQNGGRLRSYNRAIDMGIGVDKAWMATFDAHTRDSHRSLDGTVIPMDEKFHGKYGDLEYPGDPYGPPAEVYNCRCRLRGVTKYSDYDAEDLSRRFVRFDGPTPTYKEWKYGKAGRK